MDCKRLSQGPSGTILSRNIFDYFLCNVNIIMKAHTRILAFIRLFSNIGFILSSIV